MVNYSRKVQIIKEHNKRRKRALRFVGATSLIKAKYKSKRNIVIVADFSDQRTGKTTYYVTYCLNKFWITICYLPQHEKLTEINIDTWKSFVKNKIRRKFRNFRVLTMYGKDYKRTFKDFKMCIIEYPEYKEIEHLCVAYNQGEEGRKITKARLSKNLPANFCRKIKGEEDNPICQFREECINIWQFDKIIRKIKGSRLIYRENKKNKSLKDIERIKELIEERKQTHWLILLPHAYLGNIYTEKLFEAFSGEFYEEKEIATIIDESILDLSLKIIEIPKFRINYIIDFFESRKEHLSGDSDLFGIYNELEDLLMVLKINTIFNQSEVSRWRSLSGVEMSQLRRAYEATITEQKRNNITNYLQTFKEQMPSMEYLDELNEQYKLALRNYAFKAPYNIFDDLINLLRDIKHTNINTIKERIVVNLKDKDLKYPLDNKSSFIYNIERSKITIFVDAKGTEEKYYKMLPLKYRKFLTFVERENVSDFKIWCLYDQSKAFKYQFYDLERNPRIGRLEKKYNKKFFNQIERVAFWIYCCTKLKNKKKLMIAISKEFNSGKKGEEKWSGYMMTGLRGVLKKDYGIDYQKLDIELGFFYAEPGMSKFDDRECLIFFNLPGIPSEINLMIQLFLGLSKDIVDEHYSFKEQEQIAGRITNFDSLISKELCFLADAIVLSPYFDIRRPMRSIGNTLNNRELIRHLEEHSEMTTREIRDQLYPDRSVDSVRNSLNLIFEENFVLNRREIEIDDRNTKYIWSLGR